MSVRGAFYNFTNYWSTAKETQNDSWDLCFIVKFGYLVVFKQFSTAFPPFIIRKFAFYLVSNVTHVRVASTVSTLLNQQLFNGVIFVNFHFFTIKCTTFTVFALFYAFFTCCK